MRRLLAEGQSTGQPSLVSYSCSLINGVIVGTTSYEKEMPGSKVFTGNTSADIAGTADAPHDAAPTPEPPVAIGNPGVAMPFAVSKGIVRAVGKFPLAGPGIWIHWHELREPKAAEIYIDGEFVGDIFATLPLAAGQTYLITVRAPAHAAWFKRISVLPDIYCARSLAEVGIKLRMIASTNPLC